MKKIIIAVGIALLLLIGFAGCDSQEEPLIEAEDYLTTEEDENQVDTAPEEANNEATPEPSAEPTPEPTEEPEQTEPPQELDLPPATISEYGRQVAEDFLSRFTSIFTGVGQPEMHWDGETAVPTGRFTMGWDSAGQLITTDQVPAIYRSPWGEDVAFFDRQGNPIHEAPWLLVYRGDYWVSYHYASYFKLYALDHSGIPVIFIHFNQTFEGGYAGFYMVFGYRNGEYRMLETASFIDGVRQEWLLLNSVTDFFVDDYGRVITFFNSDYHGVHRYEHLVLTETHAELHFVAGLDEWDWDSGAWEEWDDYHWSNWEDTPESWRQVDGWLFHNPTIWGTDIPITPLEPLTQLQEEITVSILARIQD